MGNEQAKAKQIDRQKYGQSEKESLKYISHINRYLTFEDDF